MDVVRNKYVVRIFDQSHNKIVCRLYMCTYYFTLNFQIYSVTMLS